MEDYPILGISSMEDRTRLFHLVQIVKTFVLEDDDDNYNIDGSHEGCHIADSSIAYDGCGDPDDDWMGAAISKPNGASFSKPSGVRRRLDFSSETIDHRQKQFFFPLGSVHVMSGYNKNTEPSPGKMATVTAHLEFDARGAETSDRRMDLHSHQYDHRTGANSRTHTTERKSSYAPSYKPKPRPETVTSLRFSNRPARHKDRKRMSRKEKLCTDRSSRVAPEWMAAAMPVYESKTTNSYNYGVPQSCPLARNKK